MINERGEEFRRSIRDVDVLKLSATRTDSQQIRAMDHPISQPNISACQIDTWMCGIYVRPARSTFRREYVNGSEGPDSDGGMKAVSNSS